MKGDEAAMGIETNIEWAIHSIRLQDLIAGVALEIGLTGEEVAEMVLFALLHDIGKQSIPDSILSKPGQFSASESVIMQKHSEYGYLRLMYVARKIEKIANWILIHHERWDGNGYPLGLRKHEIPLACRVLAVIDAYDAMTNDRVYRKAMPQKEVIAELVRCAGSQFDPEIVIAFIKLINQTAAKKKEA